MAAIGDTLLMSSITDNFLKSAIDDIAEQVIDRRHQSRSGYWTGYRRKRACGRLDFHADLGFASSGIPPRRFRPIPARCNVRRDGRRP
jgi:hypothetical protein